MGRRKTCQENDAVVNPGAPSGEIGWTGYYNKNGILRFLITSKTNNRDLYYLYENKSGKLERIGRGCSSPIELCEKNNIYSRIDVDA